MAETSEKSIAAAIIVHGDRVLLVRRRITEGPFVWQFPVGEVGADETAEQAAVREALEETGLRTRAVSRLGRRAQPQTGTFLSYIACSVVSGEAHVAAPEELSAIVWAAHADIPRYVPYGLYPPVQAYLDAELPHGAVS
ncbi:NUDIX hydrolase [Streptomyces sclerotialus]|uniref:NUDIX hydrolase n=1 Tax=Streptomyces sclerotialus TaxID=1957 RepID=UPI0004CB69CE